MDILSERIKKRKNELKLTYDQIADQLYVTRVAIQNWGLGKALPNSDRIPDICRILQCTPNYLFGFSDVPSEQPVDKDINVHNNDIISRQAAIDALKANRMLPLGDHPAYNRAMVDSEKVIRNLPSAQPDKRLKRIADLVDGTIDHFDREDAMDLLYQIKEVLNER